jgi:hypothetical protein
VGWDGVRWDELFFFLISASEIARSYSYEIRFMVF